jgi:hypothetical protein
VLGSDRPQLDREFLALARQATQVDDELAIAALLETVGCLLEAFAAILESLDEIFEYGGSVVHVHVSSSDGVTSNPYPVVADPIPEIDEFTKQLNSTGSRRKRWSEEGEQRHRSASLVRNAEFLTALKPGKRAIHERDFAGVGVEHRVAFRHVEHQLGRLVRVRRKDLTRGQSDQADVAADPVKQGLGYEPFRMMRRGVGDRYEFHTAVSPGPHQRATSHDAFRVLVHYRTRVERDIRVFILESTN